MFARGSCKSLLVRVILSEPPGSIHYDKAKVQIFHFERVRALTRRLGDPDDSLGCRFLSLALDDLVGRPSYNLWSNTDIDLEVGLRSPAAESLRARLGHVEGRF